MIYDIFEITVDLDIINPVLTDCVHNCTLLHGSNTFYNFCYNNLFIFSFFLLKF